jgi:hypothetical protein
MVDEGDDLEPILGMWKAAGGSAGDFPGLLRLGNRPTLEFPMLPSEELVPIRATIFHGVSADGRRFTALTLPVRGLGQRGTSKRERSFNAALRVLAVLSGKEHVEDPEAFRVSEISFKPLPNSKLHSSAHWHYFHPNKDITYC